MKRYLIQFVFLLTIIASVAYLIPSFDLTYKGDHYTFSNLPSIDKKHRNLDFNIARLEDYFEYRIESAVQIDDKRGWFDVAREDQKTLERRVESLVGNDYEVRLDKQDNKVVFRVFSRQNLGGVSNVLSISDATLKVTTIETTLANLEGIENPDSNPSKVVDLNFKRSDFGTAEINISDGAQGQELQVRLPIGLIGPEKIKEINNRAASQLDIMVGTNPYKGTFTVNPDTYSITHLTISQLTNIQDAMSLKALLNTGNYNVAYNITSATSVKNKNGLLSFGLLAAIFILGALVINYLTLKNMTYKKFFMIMTFTVIGLAATKLFGVTITNGYLIFLMTVILLTIFSSRYIYYLMILGALVLTKLLSYLYYVDLKWSQIIILILISAAIWSTNYIKKINKKYV